MLGEKPAAEKKFIIKELASAFLGCSKRCASFVIRGSPIAPGEEVQALLDKHRLNTKHLLTIYTVFQRLRQSETDEIVRTANEIEAESVQQLVQYRRRWVSRLLRGLLVLGGIELDGTISWEEFLSIFIRFCSLSEPELCQTLFLIITRDMDSRTLHYLSKDTLQQFFSNYHKTNIKSFDTSYINFDKLPLSRYYVTDFTELATRFRELINPIIHLQQCLQSHLPGSDFWDSIEASDFTRKINIEFFTMQRVRVHLRGDPPFRETCDMLAPDALGEERLNQDQWYLRVRGLRQRSVWGEQLTPEQARAEEARVKAEKDNFEREKADYEKLFAEAQLSGLPPPTVPKSLKIAAQKTGHPLPPVALEAMKAQGIAAEPVADKDRASQIDPHQLAKQMAKEKAAAKAKAKALAEKPPRQDPELLCEEAIKLAEDWMPSVDLPPPWMRHVTVTPAPVVRGPDPPLWRLAQLGLTAGSDEWGNTWGGQPTQSSWQPAQDPNKKGLQTTKNVTFS